MNTKTLILVVVAAVVGTVVLLCGIGGIAYMATQQSDIEKVQEVWDTETSEADKNTVCSAWALSPQFMVDAFMEGALQTDVEVTRDEAREFFISNCT